MKANKYDHNTNKKTDGSPEKESNDFNLIFCCSARLLIPTLLLLRLLSAFYNNINDCDETYNYWEPSHFLIYGNGFQTWEYSPKYAIRSYAYLWLYMWPAKLLTLILGSEWKVHIFYLIRCYMAILSVVTEIFLFSSIKKTFGLKTSMYYLFTTTFAAGMFISTTSFLPSSFAMYIVCLAFGFWFRKNYKMFIVTFAFGSIISWPFIALIGLPMALALLLKIRHRFFIYALISALIILVPTVLVDSYYYGKIVVASVNIVLYNVFSSHGPNLYGTEPLSYYIYNLFLNFNLCFLVSLLAIPVLAITCLVSKRNMLNQILVILALHVWYLVFFLQAHKEERFMYPIYPLICMVTAFTLANVQDLVAGLFSKKIQYFCAITTKFLFGLFAVLSVSRILVLYANYYSSLSLYQQLFTFSEQLKSKQNTTVICLGKEWHRFPSNFFIPSGFEMEFTRSEFRGQLPKHFDRTEEYPTRIIPNNMNDLNQEETERYVDPQTQCHYMIDTDYPKSMERDYQFSKDLENWQPMISLKHVNNQQSPRLYRSFYIPFLHDIKCEFINYNLLRNRRLYDQKNNI